MVGISKRKYWEGEDKILITGMSKSWATLIGIGKCHILNESKTVQVMLPGSHRVRNG